MEAKANAPKPTCESPSPIIEFFLKTKETPIKEAHKLINNPEIKALCIKVNENI